MFQIYEISVRDDGGGVSGIGVLMEDFGQS